MNAVFATGRNEVQRTLRRRMAITYNDLFLDIRRELKQGGVIDTTLEARELTCFGVNKSREELARILRDYGEEPFAWQIAGRIVEARENSPIETTLQLADIVASAMPPAERRKNKNPSRRTFQALRIAVNHELDALEEGLDTIFDHLAPGGRLCVITFHSLEDRLVKNKFRRWSTACTCPPEFPVCVCGGKAKAKLITRKPIEADTQELEENRRSRSAHLRVLEKC